jgi:hypothetical protein
MASYTIKRTAAPPELAGNWDGPIWSRAEIGDISHYLPNSSDHHPRVQFRLLYDAAGVYLLFRVEDRFVRCVETEFNGPVCRDSCTEFFVAPVAGKGYFNFEVNCGGTMLCYYIEDATRVGEGFRKSTALTAEDDTQVLRYHSLPAVVDPEMPGPVTWFNEIHIPLALLERYVGPLGDPAGQVWQANLYKCGDETSHPHWGTWAPTEGPSFHQPKYFAPLVLEA